jgi:hypothetical protein
VYNNDVHFFKRNRDTLLLFALGIVSCSYLALCAVNVYMAFALLFACIAFYIFYKHTDAAFMMYIIILPFSYVPFLNTLPLGISTVKLLFALIITFIFLFILYKKPYKVSWVINIFLLILIAVYIIAWIRSANYALSSFAVGYAGKLSIYRYLADYVSWSFIVFIPLLIIVYFYREDKEIEKIIKTVAVSAVLLVGFIFWVFVFKVGNKGDFEAIRTELGIFTGLHGNDIANFFMLSFPVILAWAFCKKSRFSLFSLFFIIAGTVLCFSRTAYFVVAFSFLLFLFLTGKLKWIPIAALAAVLAVSFLLPDIVIERATTGIASGDFDELSAGRIDYIWEPLLNELKTDSQTLLIGSGRFGIMNTDAWKQSRITLVSHAHNMYLDSVLDAGIIGLVLFLALFAALIFYFNKCSKRYRKDFPYQSALLTGCNTSLICYLLSGFTGRTFFPDVLNAYLWIIIGLGIALCARRGYNEHPVSQ